jgi:SAM-dependent methyltransferase
VSTEDPYALIADWYDLEHDGLTEDVECLALVLSERLAGRSGHVLELGSGTGRIAAALALAGYRVLGVEPSEAMRRRCARRLAQLPERVARRVQIVPGQATDFELAPDLRFDAAVFGLNTFAHLTSPEQRLEALRRVRTYLTAEAPLILDLDLTGPRRLAESAGQLWWQGSWMLPDTAQEVSHFVAGTPGREPGVVHTLHIYDVYTPGDVVRRTTSRMPLALLSAGEVTLTLRLAGYHVETLYGGYDLAPYDESMPRALFVARPHDAA